MIIIENSAPIIQEPVSFEPVEEQTLAAQLTAIDPEDDPITWSIVGGPDRDLFVIDPDTGLLSFDTPPDFENPLDQGGDNIYNVTVRAADALRFDEADIFISVQDDGLETNIPPVITSPIAPPGLDPVIVLTGLSGGQDQQGNPNPIGQITAFDPNVTDTLEFQLFGEDSNLFTIDSATGELFFADPTTTGATLEEAFDGDRVYELDVLVSDGNGGTDTVAIDLPLFLGG